MTERKFQIVSAVSTFQQKPLKFEKDKLFKGASPFAAAKKATGHVCTTKTKCKTLSNNKRIKRCLTQAQKIKSRCSINLTMQEYKPKNGKSKEHSYRMKMAKTK